MKSNQQLEILKMMENKSPNFTNLKQKEQLDRIVKLQRLILFLVREHQLVKIILINFLKFIKKKQIPVNIPYLKLVLAIKKVRSRKLLRIL